MTTKLKPLNHDVVLKMVRSRIEDSVIITNPMEDETQKVFDIVAVSDRVTSVKVGERVIVPWTRITDPFIIDIDGKDVKVGVTDEKEILAVIDP